MSCNFEFCILSFEILSMKIAFFEAKEKDKEYFRKQFEGKAELLFFDTSINDDICPRINDVDILALYAFSPVTKKMLDCFSHLKFIATMSTGFDHIDIEECKIRNVKVSNVPTYGEITVAEHAFALIFAISRKIIESRNRVKDGNFSAEGLTGFDLCGKTLGVIGVGNIGSHTIRIAKGIGMNVLGFKKTPDPKLSEELGFKFTDMDTLLSSSDIITLHVPYSSETHHLISTEQFGKMKDGVVVINTARGAVIDTKALLTALDSKKVQAAGLDVLEGEPLLREEQELLLKTEVKQEDLLSVIENHMLLNHPNVLITPHNAFNSVEALDRIIKTTEENIASFMENKQINIVL